ncbi:MAG: ribosome-associated translation inhibitor RaiA [Phycisphaerales bacterium]|nr:ribosome-associated translation inhibitor RaiA [Phycisphaerales bacterium]
MRIDVIGRGVEVTDAIRSHAESKAGKLPRYFDGVQQITVTLNREDHQTHGDFGVEVVVDVEHHPDFVSHAKGEDLYGTIDAALHKSSRQLTDFKEKLKQGKR